jgi:hypothetical protein
MIDVNWRKAGRYVLVALPVLGLAGIAVLAHQQQDAPAQSTGDPVADAARRAQETKKHAPKPQKVFTNDDVKPAQPEPPPEAAKSASDAPAPAAGSTASTAPTDTTAPAADKNDEATWRQRFASAHDKIALAEKELDILQREQEKSQVQYYADPQKALSEQYTRKDITDRDAKIAAKKEEITKLKQDLSDLEDNLRKSGGDPGWAR